MAIEEVYIDVDSGDDSSGDGSISSPYSTLATAFTNHGSPSSGIRYSLKGTSSGSPHTSTGTLPDGNTTRPVHIAGYTTAAGDGTQAYISGGGSMIWNQTATDNINFIGITFQNYGSGYAFDIDNFGGCYDSVFDSPNGGGCNGDLDCVFVNCEFKNLAAAAHGSTDSTFYFCTFEYTDAGDLNSEIVKGKNFLNCRFYIPSASVDEILTNGSNRTGIIAGNSFFQTRGSQDDVGVRADTNSVVVHNYFEGAARGISNYGKGAYIRDNVFYDCSSDNVWDRGTGINHASANENSSTLSASGLPSISSADFTPSDDLRDAVSGLTTSGSTSGIKHQFGGVLNFPAASGGLSYTPKMRSF